LLLTNSSSTATFTAATACSVGCFGILLPVRGAAYPSCFYVMSSLSKLLCGLILLTVPTIQYGGYYLLTLLTGQTGQDLTDFQRSMFRAGHAHAGVLVILALLAQLLLDYAVLPEWLLWVARLGFPLAAVLVSAGFFAGAGGRHVTQPTPFIAVLYAGAGLLAAAVIITGIGLIRAR
jgi:hypothetical protein